MTNEEILKEVLGTKWKPDAFTEIMNKALDLARADEREGKWTPITGEDSLPNDDEALCLFAIVFADGSKRYANVEKWKIVKQFWSVQAYTHYTIIAPPNQ